jgi:ferrochelatase
MASPWRRTGLLLLNLGTPSSATVGDVRRYLREFLGDPRVIDTSRIVRWLVANVAMALRAPKSAAAYAKIWTQSGSPLLQHGFALRAAVAERLGTRATVELAMRYGEPSIQSALERLSEAEVDRIVVLPLFPQYASSSSGSALERTLQIAAGMCNVPTLETVSEFYDEPGFIAALSEVARPPLDEFRADHLLMSYHGLPERHLRRADPSGTHCLESDDCCESIGSANRRCYRAQCAATSRALAAALELEKGSWSMSFQSRLGRTPWIHPFTDEVLPQLARRGIARLAVVCPSFAADCLETLEEIGIRGREQWHELGGEAFELIPCVNSHPRWVDTVAAWTCPPDGG